MSEKIITEDEKVEGSKDRFRIELIIVTFGLVNTLKAAAEISGINLSAMIEKIFTPKNAQDRQQVSGVYLDFLRWHIEKHGLPETVRLISSACHARAKLNQAEERTKLFAETWTKNGKAIWYHYKQLTGEAKAARA